MKKLINITITALIVGSFFACNDDAKFKVEQYKKVLYLLSLDDQTFPVEYPLDGTDSVEYVSVACGGTNPIEQDVKVELEKDTILFKKYNKSNYDIDVTRFAHLLDPSRFNIPFWSVTLKAGDKDPYALVPIRIRPENLEGLSPDSIYFIPLSIKSASAYEINPDKRNVLCRVYMKNRFAEIKNATYYSVKGYMKEEKTGSSESAVVTLKMAHPLSKNSFRIFAGINAFATNLATINKYALKIQVNADNTIAILPYKTGTLEVQQLTPPNNPDFIYTNVYEETKDLKLFRLYYRYRTLEKSGWSNWITMKEIDRMVVTN